MILIELVKFDFNSQTKLIFFLTRGNILFFMDVHV